MARIINPGLRIPVTNKVVVPTSASIYAGVEGTLKKIGFIQEISYDSTRTVERIREISATRAGRVIEQVPKPEDMTVRCSGLALYESNSLSQLCGENEPFFALNHQYIPFDVEILEYHPISSVTPRGFKVVLQGCWLSQYSHPLRIRDMYITESASLQPTSISSEPYDGSEDVEDRDW
jgi:hypothetical protein